MARSKKKPQREGKNASSPGPRKKLESGSPLQAKEKAVPGPRGPPKSPKAEPASTEDHFPFVGIGTSAGGLNALKRLLAKVPVDSGIAYVIVAHLSPDYPSHLPELIQRATKMPVLSVSNTVRVEPNHVYVIPPNANLDAIDTHLRLTELEERRAERAPIDHFFRTLAIHHEGRAIGVVLSGTGSDGTLGLRKIKELGGLAIVQDPIEAEYDGMPRNAIAGAPVDLVLPLSEIPAAIVRFAQTAPRLEVPRDDEDAGAQTRQFLQKIFAQVRARTGRDFSYYKRSTLLRRIARRMQFNQVAEPASYLELLRKQPAEVHSLADELLINVTSFFRDPEVFELLAKDVVPRIFDSKQPGETVRVWSVGCATGEEAYSLAMLLLDEAAKRENAPAIQVFATDLHHGSLEKAREGAFTGDLEQDVGADRLRRYFKKEPGGYRPRSELREAVIFAPHNILSDPPFSRLDLVSCRNLMIYLDRDLHRQLAELFHYALNPNGFLILGSSETVDGTELFLVESKKRCIFKKRSVPGPVQRLPVFPVNHGQAPATRRREQSKDPPPYSTLHHELVEEQGPPSVLVSPDDNVVHFSAQAGRYLVHPGGSPTMNVVKLVRDELRIELRSALSSARAGMTAVRTKSILVRFGGVSFPVVLDARPAPAAEHEGFVLLLFDEYPSRQDASAPASTAARLGPSSRATPPRLKELEADKQRAEERLQQLIEEHETSQEEIRASNEELQSANEELRSTLEELETSKEELQSMNEELHTLNQENRQKVEELGQLSSDLQNLLVATDIATLFLDRDLRIMRFTPKIEQLFNVRFADRGRPLSDFTSRIGYDDLNADAIKVLERLVPIERETVDDAGCWYLTRVLPYRSQEDRIEGIVITFVEITRQKEAERRVRESKETSERILDTLPEPLLVLKRDFEIISANGAYYRFFQALPEETEGRSLYEVAGGQWNGPELVRALHEGPALDGRFDDIEMDRTFDRIGRRVMVLKARRLDGEGLILLGFHDITERFDSEQEARESEGILSEQLIARDEYLAMLGHELRNPLGAIRNASELLRIHDTADVEVRRIYELLDRQATHMSRIIDGLLDVSRIARGKITVHPRALDLREVVRGVVDVRESQMKARGLTFRVKQARDALWVDGDEARLSQVVDNLLGNAIKFTDASGSIALTSAREDSSALVRVEDTGVGIRRDVLPLIFQPFHQEVQDVARTAGGLGLGLALAKGLVDLHGGTIEARSDGLGKGSTFEVRLPLRSAPEEPEAPSEPSASSRGPHPARQVLVVEDNTDAAEMLKALLELDGHDVNLASTAPVALASLRKRRPDVVVCDIGLPGMSGFEFATLVRRDPELRDIPMVALSGYGQPEDRKRTLSSGFDDHLVKPVDKQALCATLERLTRAHAS